MSQLFISIYFLLLIRLSIALVCDPTVENCLTCSGSTFSCSDCKNGFVNYKGSCLSTCPSPSVSKTIDGETWCVEECPMQTYFDDLDNECKSCHSSCGSCFGPADSECTSCPLNFFISITNKCEGNY